MRRTLNRNRSCRLAFCHPHTLLAPDDSSYGSRDDRSGGHVPISGRSSDAPARSGSAYAPHATPFSRDGAPSAARVKSSRLDSTRFSRHDEPFIGIDAALSPAPDQSAEPPKRSPVLIRHSVGPASHSVCRCRHPVCTPGHSVRLPAHSLRPPPCWEIRSHKTDLPIRRL